MTATPENPGAAPGGLTLGADAADEDVDVLYLAGQRPPADGAWLQVTTAEAGHGGEFTALFLPGDSPAASGGDVLLHITPGATPATEPGPTARVHVAAVVAGTVIGVASWDPLRLEDWPETIRPVVTFVLGAMTELRARGADLGASSGLALLDSAGGTAATGFPALPASARPAADG